MRLISEGRYFITSDPHYITAALSAIICRTFNKIDWCFSSFRNVVIKCVPTDDGHRIWLGLWETSLSVDCSSASQCDGGGQLEWSDGSAFVDGSWMDQFTIDYSEQGPCTRALDWVGRKLC